MDDRLAWGQPSRVPDDARAAWGCRAIDEGDRIDIVWDRVDCVGPEAERDRLRALLEAVLPPDQLSERCAALERSDDPHVLHDGDEVHAIARRFRGYVYVTAWLKP